MQSDVMNSAILDRQFMNLQATLSASTAGCAPGCPAGVPHHPITCASALTFDAQGRLACEHGQVEADDERTLFAIDHSIAMLLMEVAAQQL